MPGSRRIAEANLLGVTRQIDDCTADAARRGWPVAEVYVDDDVSAYSGKHRPAYRRMLEDIRDSRIDAVVVWNLDRLHRHPKELEEFFEVCATAGVSQLASVSGDVDLSTGEGQFYARIQGAVARKESDDKSRRAKTEALELAQAGRWSGSARAFGYDAALARRPRGGGRDPRDGRAAPVRGVTAHARQGSADAPGPDGARSTLVHADAAQHSQAPSPRRFRSLRGEVVTRGVWEPILSEEESARVRALLADPSRRLTRPARTYPLKGFLYCGVCGMKLVSRPNHGQRTYVCGAGNGLRGCGGVSIVGEPLEEFVTDAVLFRLGHPGPRGSAEPNRQPRDRSADLLSSLRADEAQLEELARAYARKQISLSEWAHRSQRDRRPTRRAAGSPAAHRSPAHAPCGCWPGQCPAAALARAEPGSASRRHRYARGSARGPSRPAPQAHPI